MQTAAKNFDFHEYEDYKKERYSKESTMKKVKNDNSNNKQNKKKSAVIRGSQKKVMFQALFLGAFLVALIVGFTAFGTTTEYNINKMEGQISELKNDINDINLQITAKSSPETIESRAINELGMVYPSASQYVYINSFSEGVYNNTK